MPGLAGHGEDFEFYPKESRESLADIRQGDIYLGWLQKEQQVEFPQWGYFLTEVYSFSSSSSIFRKFECRPLYSPCSISSLCCRYGPHFFFEAPLMSQDRVA